MEPRIQYAKTTDGVSIAFWTMGEGPPVVNLQPQPWSNTEFEAKEWPWHGILASRCTVVRYDYRGTGLSERDVDDFSLDAYVLDLEGVVERLGLEQFVLFPEGPSGPIAITYAAHHPDRVSHLLLFAGVARTADYYDLPRVRNAYAILEQGDWEMFADALGLATAGWSDAGLARDLSRFLRTCVEPENARAVLEAQRQVDVTELLPLLQMPVSIVYPKESGISDIGTARTLAARVPQARLTVADSNTAWSPEIEKAVLGVLDEALAELAGAPASTQPGPSSGGLVTILFTDMESSTSLTQRLGDTKAQELVRTHNTIVRDALKAHGGSEVKHTGDGIMASFSSASRAIECAIAIQRAFAQHKDRLLRQAQDERAEPVEAQRAEPVEAPLRVRIGLNAGEPVAEDQDLFGTAVQLAARICAQAEPGQILIPDGVRHLIAGKGFLFSDHGDVALRGFEDPVRLYEVRWERD